MKVIYIAGPYSGKTCWERQKNIHRAMRYGAHVASLGHMPLIPHANTANMDGLMPHQFWLDGTMELMRRCDAVLCTYDWESSSGAKAEVTEANKLGIPAFTSFFRLEEWLEADEQPKAPAEVESLFLPLPEVLFEMLTDRSEEKRTRPPAARGLGRGLGRGHARRAEEAE